MAHKALHKNWAVQKHPTTQVDVELGEEIFYY